MNEEQRERGKKMLEKTAAVLEAVSDENSGDRLELALEEQRIAFSEFSRHCDTRLALDATTRRYVDEVLELKESIVSLLNRKSAELRRESAAITGRQKHAQAFAMIEREAPRFIARHV